MENQKRAFSLRQKDKGVTGVEFAILVAGIALAISAGGMVLGQGISSKLINAEQQIQNQAQTPAAPAAPRVGAPGGDGGSGSGGPDNAGGNAGGDFAGGPPLGKEGSQAAK
jgi:Flp pilus assembly pilin Flp